MRDISNKGGGGDGACARANRFFFRFTATQDRPPPLLSPVLYFQQIATALDAYLQRHFDFEEEGDAAAKRSASPSAADTASLPVASPSSSGEQDSGEKSSKEKKRRRKHDERAEKKKKRKEEKKEKRRRERQGEEDGGESVRVFARVPRGAPCLLFPPQRLAPAASPSAASLPACEVADLRAPRGVREARAEASKAAAAGALAALAAVPPPRWPDERAETNAPSLPAEGVVIDPREARPFVPHDVRMRVLTTGRA